MQHRPITGSDIVDDLRASNRGESYRPLSFSPPTHLFGKTIPERRWIVQDWLPAGHVTLNYGDGGVGKTLLAQQLMTSTATGLPWCGLAVTPCRTLGLFCEDDQDELHRRQDSINRAYGIEFTHLTNMQWASSVGQDNALIRFTADGRPHITGRLLEIQEEALDYKAELVVIDTAADTFGGNENDRAQVRQYIGHTLNGLAQTISGAVLLNAHPSRTGMSQTGDMDGGSTAWSNTARSRWSLTRPPANADAETDQTERTLTRRKSNYAAVGESIPLRWQAGVLVPVHQPTGFAAMASWAEADGVFMALLDRFDGNGIRLSESKHGKNWAPKQMASAPDRKGLTLRDFEGAMNRLLAERKIVVKDFGRKGRPERALAAAETPQE